MYQNCDPEFTSSCQLCRLLLLLLLLFLLLLLLLLLSHISENLILNISRDNHCRFPLSTGLSLTPPSRFSVLQTAGSSPGNDRVPLPVTSAIHIYRNEELKRRQLSTRLSFEIGIGGEGDKKLFQLISQIRVRKGYGITERWGQVQKRTKSISQQERFKATTYTRLSKRRNGVRGERI